MQRIFPRLLLTLVIATPSLSAQESAELFRRPIVVDACRVRPFEDVQVPAKVSGTLFRVMSERGAVVKQGQVLAEFDVELMKIEVESKQKEAGNEAAIKAAEARFDVAKTEAETAQQLNKNNNISLQEYRRAIASLTLASEEHLNALNKQELAKIDLRGAQAKLGQHQVLSPVDGVVIEQIKKRGEAVQALDPIYRIIRADKVKVEGELQLRDRYRVKAGDRVEVYPTKSGEILQKHDHTEIILTVKILPDGKLCAFGDAGGRIFLWDLPRNQLVKRLDGHTGPVTCLATLTAKPDMLVSGSEDGTLRMWNVTTGTARVLRTPGSVKSILAVAIHPQDASRCVTGHEDRSIRMWDLDNEKILQTYYGHTNYVTSVTFSSDGSHLLSAGTDSTVRWWDMTSGKALEFPGRSPEVQQIGLSADDKYFLFNRGSLVQMYSLPDGFPVAKFESGRGGRGFDGVALFVPRSRMVLLNSEGKRLQLWEPGVDGRPERLVRLYEDDNSDVRAVDFAADGSYFVAAGRDRTLRVCGIPDAKQVARERKTSIIGVVGDLAEGGNQVVSFVTDVENQDAQFLPGMFATVVIFPQSLPAAAATR